MREMPSLILARKINIIKYNNYQQQHLSKFSKQLERSTKYEHKD